MSCRAEEERDGSGPQNAQYYAMWREGGAIFLVDVRQGVNTASFYMVPDIKDNPKWSHGDRVPGAESVLRSSGYGRLRRSEREMRSALARVADLGTKVHIVDQRMHARSPQYWYGEGAIEWRWRQDEEQETIGCIELLQFCPEVGTDEMSPAACAMRALVAPLYVGMTEKLGGDRRPRALPVDEVLARLSDIHANSECAVSRALAIRAACALGHTDWVGKALESEEWMIREAGILCLLVCGSAAADWTRLVHLLRVEPVDSVRVHLVRHLARRADAVEQEKQDMLAASLRAGVCESWALLAMELAKRGRREGLLWFREAFTRLQQATPLNVSYYAGECIDLPTDPEWFDDAGKKRVIEAWLALMKNSDDLVWNPAREFFEVRGQDR